MRSPSGETTIIPIAPRVDSNRSGAVQSPEGPLRVALRRSRLSAEAHTARSPSGDRLAEAGGSTSCSGGLDQLGDTCAAGGLGAAGAPAAGSAAMPLRQSSNVIGRGSELAR